MPILHALKKFEGSEFEMRVIYNICMLEPNATVETIVEKMEKNSFEQDPQPPKRGLITGQIMKWHAKWLHDNLKRDVQHALGSLVNYPIPYLRKNDSGTYSLTDKARMIDGL